MALSTSAFTRVKVMQHILSKGENLISPLSPSFPESEYAQRLANVRQAMMKAEIDLLLVNSTPNIAYLAGYEPPRGNSYICLILPIDGDAGLFVHQDEAGLIPQHKWIKEMYALSSYDRRLSAKRVSDYLVESGFQNKSIGFEKGRYPVAAESYSQLTDKLSSAKIKDATALIMDLRLVKSPAEIECMRQAAKYTNVGIKAAHEAIRVGNTDNDIGASAYSAMIRAGSEAAYPAPFIMKGVRTGWGPHLSWKRFPLKEGEPLCLEMTGTYNRYAAPIYRTAVLGEPSDIVRKVCNAVIDTVNQLLDNAKPGMSANDLALAAHKGMDPIKDIIYCTGQVGYGIGLTLAPNWVEHSFRIIPGNERPIVPGMAFHSPTAVRIPGEFAIGFSEAWVMTESGPEILTNYPREILQGQV